MTHFNGPTTTITLDVPTAGVLSLSVETNLYSEWKEWVLGRYLFDTEDDVNGITERITYVDHSLHTGQSVFYFVEGGSENIGLVDGTEYFIRADDASGDRDTFELYDTEANAEAGPSTTGRLDLTASGVGNGETHRIAADNSKFLAAFRTIGGDELTPGVEAGPYFFLQNGTLGDTPPQGGWRIISTDEDQTINYQGNLVAEESDTSIILVTAGRSVLHLGLQPVTQRVDEILILGQVSEYDGFVWIDTINGTPGTTYPSGTPTRPVDTLDDALTIGANLSFEEFKLRGPLTLDVPMTDISITGFGTHQIDILDFGGQDISGSEFLNLTIQGNVGTLTADAIVRFGLIGALTDFQGGIFTSGFTDTVTLAPGQTNFVNCFSVSPGEGVIDFDFQAGNLIELFVRGFFGLFNITNSTNASSLASIDLTSGIVDIDSTWIAGIVNIRGTGSYDNNSLLTINDTGLIDQADVLLIKQMTSGNATVSIDDLLVTVLDEDDVTVLATFSLSADGRIRTRLT